MPPVEHYPNVGRMAVAASHEGGLGYSDDDVEFAFGLDLIVDGLDASAADGSQHRPNGAAPVNERTLGVRRRTT